VRLTRGALASRNFRLLLGCEVIAGTGNAVAFVAIPFAVLAIGGSVADIGYVSSAMLFPTVVFLLVGGVVGDRMARHKVIMVANIIEGAAQAVSALLVLTGHAEVWELAVLAAVRGLGLGLYFPAAQGLLPQTVPPDQRAQANAIDRVGRNSALIGGFALGGVLVGLAGPGWGLAADAIGFGVAAALRTGMRFPAMPDAPPAANMIHELCEGWREFIARRWLWVIVAEFAIMMVVIVGVIDVLGPAVAQASLGGARSWGFIMAANGIGAVLGGLIMIKYRPVRMLLVASIAAGVYAVFLFALAVPLSVPLIAASGLLIGVTSEVFLVNWVTTMQQEIPPDLLSRLSAYDGMGSMALSPVGVAIAGPIAAAIGTTTALVWGGLIIVALTVVVLTVPEVRQLRRRAAEPERAPASEPELDAASQGTAASQPAGRAGPDATAAPAESG
jgi:MFS family permease